MKSWFLRYKIYHIPFWVAYHLTWWTVSVGSPVSVFSHLGGSPYIFKTFFYIVFQALAVYFNLYFLIPKLLENGKYALYLGAFIVTTVGVAALIVPGYFMSAERWNTSTESLYGSAANSFWYFFRHLTLPSTFAAMTLGMSVKLAKSWLQARQREQTLKEEKLETELKFLRSQLNPHFLFNTINTIFVLIHKNQEEASSSLLKFSDLLRYQLYECHEPFIPLEKEIAYMQNFIALERLRYEKELALTVELPEMIGGDLRIAPFILLPFVENAFKHVPTGKKSKSFITIHLTLVEDKLSFRVGNSYENKALEKNRRGIGLANVQRRLELIYLQEYALQVDKTEEEFNVQLTIRL